MNSLKTMYMYRLYYLVDNLTLNVRCNQRVHTHDFKIRNKKMMMT